jgi:hypothetical protein
MRTFFRLIILIASAWLLDVAIFQGRYSQAFWQNAQLQGQKFRYEVHDWLSKTGL